jgi:putative oxidoreductase
MKALLLLALRITTGALLILWGSIKAFAPETAIHVSDKYYSGALSDGALQTPMGLAQIVLGALVILGLLRRITYSVQAIVLVVGAAAIWKYIADPLGLYLMTEETRQVLFFPSTTVAIASLILLAFLDEDGLSLDRLLFKR